MNARGQVIAQGNITSQNADIRGETYTNGWFRTRGDSGWYSEKWGGGWYMSDSTWVRSWMNKSIYTGGQVRGGQVRSDGRTYVGEYLQLGGVATEGAGCAPNGLVGRNAAGLTLSCQSGVWRSNGGGVTGHKNCSWIVGSPYQTRICPSPKVLVGYNYIGYGSGYSDHHAYCCELE
ncbi:hypothetical protein D9M68_822690 [compost metagenome]